MSAERSKPGDGALRLVSFTSVRIDDTFWASRMRTNREQTIPFEYLQCKSTGRIDAFKLDWQPGKEPRPHIFWDSDVAKWIEAASYSLATQPDPDLDALLDGEWGLSLALDTQLCADLRALGPIVDRVG